MYAVCREKALCRFFGDKRVKVSLFLQDGIQKSDGTITLSYRGETPPGVEIPGKISYFDPSGSSIGVDSFSFPEAELMEPGRRAGDTAGLQTHLGSNLYAKEKAAGAPASGAGDTAAAAVVWWRVW